MFLLGIPRSSRCSRKPPNRKINVIQPVVDRRKRQIRLLTKINTLHLISICNMINFYLVFDFLTKSKAHLGTRANFNIICGVIFCPEICQPRPHFVLSVFSKQLKQILQLEKCPS